MVSRIACPVLWVGRAVRAMYSHRQAVLTPSRGRDKRPAGRASWSLGRRRAALVMLQHHGTPHSSPKNHKARPRYHELLNQDTSGLHHLNCTPTTAFRGFRLGARRAMVSTHHKRRATTSGSLETPPFGLLFPLPRGVGRACRCASIARALPPVEETGKAIVGVQLR